MITKHHLNCVRLSHQHGFLAFIAVLLVLVIGFIGTTVVYMIAGSSGATLDFEQSENALFIAESGFEKAARFVLTPTLSGANARIGCASITSNSNLTATTFNTGVFTATTVASNPVYTRTTLSSAINNSVTTIPVTSTSGFAAAGRIVIDNEIINYGAISGNSFIAVQRGVNANYNTPHASGAPVAQYQCMIDVKGGIPTLTSPTYQREIQQAVQLQEGWAAGVLSGSTFVLTRWNRPTEVTWTNSAVTSASKTNLNGISMLSNADGWAVGNIVSSNFTLLHWNGSSWSLSTLASACSNQNLAAVSSVYSNEAWAVGATYRIGSTCTNSGGTRRITMVKWNGTSWSIVTPSTSPSTPADASTNQNMNAIHVIDTNQSGAGNLGFAVGAGGQILKYNGTAWTIDTSPTTNALNGVYIVSSSEAWAVGASGTIIKWNGSTWSTVSSPTTTQLNAITMTNNTLGSTASGGWAVGNSGVAITYNGTSWSSQNTGSANNLLGVSSFYVTNDTWAVGAAGTIMHWDGTSWTSISSGVTTQLNGISLIAPQQYPFAWQEIFP